jgi:hypothetical protein
MHRELRGMPQLLADAALHQRAGAATDIALAHAAHRRVDRHDERRVPRRPGARNRGFGHGSSTRHVELIPERTWRIGPYVFEPLTRER